MKQYKYKINGNLYNVTVNDVEDNIANVEVNGTSYKVELDKPVKAAPKPVTRPAAAPKTETGAPVVTKQPTASKKDGVKSPLPGVILDIKVKEGDTVKRGQTIIILEAMKMENDIVAPQDGTVASINVSTGDSVESGAVLATLN
jgi:biotin carboxyl carrier protein